ncbi:PEP-CTERM sorting domain-containing protein [Fimbriimonadia bacterium ATM]|nr:MAG: PEP-CTERM sorting domain-containing protein [Armatimonadota bacterium]MBC6970438.1 PEP-CTERM sorting domain-containing protein [Armatimonadota bacterium]MCE7899699.1 PEP-CTERM sorting domain-containing protein [Armatimonadetes bacterium ATM1]MDL1927784.1 PEP-CTERM sorting domain-containing protein [Fimbriimonadia bacterium ATM]RIJ95312.1 MAG: hypothetical protein DCC45_10215 [Armatimonadota bacterium]
MKLRGLLLAGVLVGVPLSGNAYLLLQSASGFTSGRTIGTADLWRVYIPFDVASPGWSITTIGVDGWEITDPGNTGFTGTLLPDDGSGTTANDAAPIASATHDFNGGAGQSNWTDAAYNVVVGPGRYWLRLTPPSGSHWSANYFATSGLVGYSIRGSTGERFGAGSPTTIRVDGTVVPEPATLLAVGAGLAALAARRRK